jgi:hypothetical protein
VAGAQIQPPILPRPDLARLGIAYRRIPVLAVGRDVYLDTRLILRKFESSAAAAGAVTAGSASASCRPPLGAPAGTDAAALERLLAVLTTATDLFARAAALLPRSLPLMRDPAFRRDRRDFFFARDGAPRRRQGDGDGGDGGGGGDDAQDDGAEGGEVGAEAEAEAEAAAQRAEALHAVKAAFDLLEHTLLADGRAWVLGGAADAGPTLADIEAVWPFHWMTGIPGMLSDVDDNGDSTATTTSTAQQISSAAFPRVYAWVARFQAAVGAAKERVRAGRVSGEEAARILLRSGFLEREEEVGVDETEPLARACGLRRGSWVEVWPTDYGAAHRDRGRLVGLGPDEVVWETDAGVRVHAPRLGFRVRPAAVAGVVAAPAAGEGKEEGA